MTHDAPDMSLEEQRKANMARNASMMRQFKLQEANNATFEKEKPKPTSKSAPRSKRKAEPVMPQRKSRRLQGIKLEEEELPEAAVKVEPEPYKNERKEGELQLKQLIEDGKLDQTLEILQQFGDSKVNISDYFDSIEPNDGIVKDLRTEFEQLSFDDRTVRITDERVYSIAMHPSRDKRLVVAGDKVGQLGLWDADAEDDTGLTQINAHTQAVAMVHFNLRDPSKLYSGSYDGSIRVLDLANQKSVEAFVSEQAVSDFELVDNSLYFSTLDGQFCIADERASKAKVAAQLSEKKIGGFSVSPDGFQIATASLDRTMKVWDVRNLEEPLGTYDSRLSISSTSWNKDNQIVCNGYDNTINIFDAANLGEMKPTVRLKHNCQTGRWVSILKSRWQQNPRDGVQKVVIGDMNRCIDIFAADGQQIARLDEGVTAVPAVVAMHRENNWVVGGNATGKVFIWS